MNSTTRLLNDYARRIAALPERAREHANSMGIADPSERAVEALKFVEVFVRIITDEMRTLAEYHNAAQEAA